MKQMNLKNKFFLLFIGFLATGFGLAQDVELVGIELVKAPPDFEDLPANNLGIKLSFFVRDTAIVTGLTRKYTIAQWVTDTGKDLKQEHLQLAKEAVQKDYYVARDTALLSNRGFGREHGKGFVFKIHGWVLPDSLSTSIKIKGTIDYTVLEPGDVLVEDITHLAGNISMLGSLEFMGNNINLMGKIYGKGEDAYKAFNGTVANNTYEVAIQKMEFMDDDKNVLDELYFGFSNQYNTNTRNRVDLDKTAIIRIYYRKLKVKKVFVEKNFGLGF